MGVLSDRIRRCASAAISDNKTIIYLAAKSGKRSPHGPAPCLQLSAHDHDLAGRKDLLISHRKLGRPLSVAKNWTILSL